MSESKRQAILESRRAEKAALIAQNVLNHQPEVQYQVRSPPPPQIAGSMPKPALGFNILTGAPQEAAPRRDHFAVKSQFREDKNVQEKYDIINWGDRSTKRPAPLMNSRAPQSAPQSSNYANTSNFNNSSSSSNGGSGGYDGGNASARSNFSLNFGNNNSLAPFAPTYAPEINTERRSARQRMNTC
jgi:hypothetical protein